MSLPSEEEFLAHATPVLPSSLPDPPICPICVKEFSDDPDEVAIAFSCHPTHITCRRCITYIEPSVNGQVLCPHCRAPAFTVDMEVLEDVEDVEDEPNFPWVSFEEYQDRAWGIFMRRMYESNGILRAHWHPEILDRSRIADTFDSLATNLDTDGFSYHFIRSYLDDLRGDRTYYAAARRHLLFIEYEIVVDREPEVENLTHMMITKEDLIVWPSIQDRAQEDQIHHSELDNMYMVYRAHEDLLEDIIETHKRTIMNISEFRAHLHHGSEYYIRQVHAEHISNRTMLPWTIQEELTVIDQFIEAIISRGMRKYYRRLWPRHAPLLADVPVPRYPSFRDIAMLQGRYGRRWDAANRNFAEVETERAFQRHASVNQQVHDFLAAPGVFERVRRAAIIRDMATEEVVDDSPSEDEDDAQGAGDDTFEMFEGVAELFQTASMVPHLASDDGVSENEVEHLAEQIIDPEPVDNGGTNDTTRSSSRDICGCIPLGIPHDDRSDADTVVAPGV